MIATLIRWAALLATAFVVLSFLFFVASTSSRASQNQVNAIVGGSNVNPESATKLPNPPPRIEALRQKENDSFHEFVDDVDDVLLSPFTGITHSNSIWVRRLVPLAFALVIYGLGGMYLARTLGLRRW